MMRAISCKKKTKCVQSLNDDCVCYTDSLLQLTSRYENNVYSLTSVSDL